MSWKKSNSRGGLRVRIKIIGTGRAVPARCVTSRTLDEKLGLSLGQLEAATGVVERYVCDAESQVDLACAAARLALADAAIEASEIDLVVGGCGVPYQPLPSTAPLVMQRLGMADGSAAAFDVNSTCLGFLTAFETAGRMIEAGQANGRSYSPRRSPRAPCPGKTSRKSLPCSAMARRRLFCVGRRREMARW